MSPAPKPRWPVQLRIGLMLSLSLLGIVLLSFVWTPYDVSLLAISDRLHAPSATHLLGTDQLGRDVMSMLMEGGRISIAVAILAVGIGISRHQCHHRHWHFQHSCFCAGCACGCNVNLDKRIHYGRACGWQKQSAHQL